QQGRTNVGIIFAATEGVLALTSIAAFFAYNSLLSNRTISLDDRLTPTGTYDVTLRGILPERQHEANVWRAVKYASGGAFWVTYAAGVVDALIHHKPEIVLPAASGPGPSASSSSSTAGSTDRQSTREVRASPAGVGIHF